MQPVASLTCSMRLNVPEEPALTTTEGLLAEPTRLPLPETDHWYVVKPGALKLLADELGHTTSGPSMLQDKLVPTVSVALALVFVPQGLLNTARYLPTLD